MEGTIGEIRLFAGNFAPRNWAYCQGQLLAISSNTALFSILGTTYGGDGRTTFGLPDLRGRVAVGTGRGPGLSERDLGQMGGVESVTLNLTQIPTHTHSATGSVSPLCTNGQGDETNPGGGYMASSTAGDLYASGHNATMGASPVTVTIGNTGGNQSHENMQPFLVLNYIICMYGVFPSRG